MKKSIIDAEELEKSVIINRDRVLCTIGNLVHDSVPIFKDEVCLMINRVLPEIVFVVFVYG